MPAFIVTAIIAVLIQGYAGAALRGLYADGPWHVNQILAHRSFILHPERLLSSLIDQFPVLLAVYVGADTPHAAALVFSIATNLLPGLFILLCLPALPAAERHFFVFPAFVYFAGTLSAQFASVVEGLVAISYFWLLLCLVVFGRLTALRLTIVTVLALGTMWLHEEMLFLGPILAAACATRWPDHKEFLSRFVLLFVALCGLASTSIAAFKLLHWHSPTEPTSFIGDFLAFHWLYSPYGGWNLPCVLAILAVQWILIAVLRPAWRPVLIWSFAGVSVSLAFASFWLDWLAFPGTQFGARHNAGLISVPIALLMLGARLHPQVATALTRGAVREIVMTLGLAVSLWHVSATERWSAYLAHLSNVLQSRTGVIPWEAIAAPLGSRPAKLAETMLYGWVIPDLSLIAVQRWCVTSVIDYPAAWAGARPHNVLELARELPIPGLIYTYRLAPDHLRRKACSTVSENPSTQWATGVAQRPFLSMADALGNVPAGSPIAAEEYLQESVANYRNCIAANPMHVRVCEKWRYTMNSDAKGLSGEILNGRPFFIAAP